MNYCPNCSARIEDDLNYCIECGVKFDSNFSNNKTIENPILTSQNTLSNQGSTGFVLALISLFLPIPIIDAIIGIIGFIFSINGLKEEKTGLAVAGLIISILAIVGSVVLLLTDGYDFF